MGGEEEDGGGDEGGVEGVGVGREEGSDLTQEAAQEIQESSSGVLLGGTGWEG